MLWPRSWYIKVTAWLEQCCSVCVCVCVCVRERERGGREGGGEREGGDGVKKKVDVIQVNTVLLHKVSTVRNNNYLHIFVNIVVLFQIIKYMGWANSSSNMCGTWRKALLYWNLPLCALNVCPVMWWTLSKMTNAISRLNLVDIFRVPLYCETA